jgi:hypothetical protein
VPLSTADYLGVPPACYAGVMRDAARRTGCAVGPRTLESRSPHYLPGRDLEHGTTRTLRVAPEVRGTHFPKGWSVSRRLRGRFAQGDRNLLIVSPREEDAGAI